MLLEFRVSNYRSIRDEQVFSWVAAPADKLHASTHLQATGLKALPHVVSSAVIYGANASGKSSLLAALHYMVRVVAESATVVQPNHTYAVQSFKLDATKAAEPTRFELSFLFAGVRYEYAFAMRPERFMSESLVAYHSAQPTQLFSRQLNPDGQTYDYKFSSSLKGSKQLWQESTRANALFLSTAAQLNSDVLGPVFTAIAQKLVYIPSGAMINFDFSTQLLTTQEGRSAVKDFLAGADISIASIEAVARKEVRQEILFDAASGNTHTNRAEGEFLRPLFEHVTSNGSAKFEINEESEGTRRLFGLAAPVFDVLGTGRTLVVDELDSSLHTLLVKHLVGMFHNPDLNRKGAQLVFTTHDTALLDTDLFRRDQIWLIEKDENQASKLYPLTDFSPRNNEALERNYLAGRYGAIPFLPGSKVAS
jgi:uncharacterized protein